MKSVVCVMALAAVAALASVAYSQKVSNAVAGEKLFLKIGCSQCHGTHGAGGGNFGPPIARTALPEQAFIVFVRQPPPGPMPGYPVEVLTDAQILDIAAFLKAQPRGKSASDIPLLSR